MGESIHTDGIMEWLWKEALDVVGIGKGSEKSLTQTVVDGYKSWGNDEEKITQLAHKLKVTYSQKNNNDGFYDKSWQIKLATSHAAEARWLRSEFPGIKDDHIIDFIKATYSGDINAHNTVAEYVD